MGKQVRSVWSKNGRPISFVVMVSICLGIGLLWILASPTSLANPFQTISQDHTAYRAVHSFLGYGLGRSYVEDRIQLGESLTNFDLALWLGEAVEKLREEANHSGDVESPLQATLSELVAVYNKQHPKRQISSTMEKSLAETIVYLAGHLQVLGYTLPPEFRSAPEWSGMQFQVSSLIQDFLLKSQTRTHIYGQSSASSFSAVSDPEHGTTLWQSHRLQTAGRVTDRVNLGAELEAGGRFLTDSSEQFQLQSAAVDIGFPYAGMARIGRVTGRGISELAMDDSRYLSGLRAGLVLGDLGSTLIVGKYDIPGEADGQDGRSALVTAWDGSVQVSDRLQLGATVAHLENDSGSEDDEVEKTVIRLGGIYNVSPQLTLSGEMAKSGGDGPNGGAVKIGAVLHPLPEVTFGAFLLSSGLGYRPLLSEDADRMSRLDLSAEVGRWILSLRKISRTSLINEGDGDTPTEESDEKTSVDLQVHFDQGRLSLGYVLENAKDLSGSSNNPRPIRITSASVEHTMGSVGKALAGFSITDQEEGSETSSNVGLRYDFDDMSVSLQYEIFNKLGDIRENVTMAEVSIKF